MSNIPEEAVRMTKQNLLRDPSFVSQITEQAGFMSRDETMTAISQAISQITLTPGPQGQPGAKGDAGATGAVGQNATTTAIATTTTNGLMSGPDKAKVDGLGKTTLATGTAPIPAIALGGSVNVTVVFSKPLPVTPQSLAFSIWGVALGSITITEVSKTAAQAVLNIKSSALLSAGGTLQVIAYAEVN